MSEPLAKQKIFDRLAKRAADKRKAMRKPKRDPKNAEGVRAILVPETSNSKINGIRNPGRVATTYTSTVASCPRSCALYLVGCYGKNGPVGFTERWLSRGAKRLSSLATARQEAKAILAGIKAFRGGRVPRDGSKGKGRPLRLHTVGDAITTEAASELAAASQAWKDAGGGHVWSYTHAGCNVPRSAWGCVSILASMDTADQIPALERNGYAIARYVDAFPNGMKAWEEHGKRWRPCPAQATDKHANPAGWETAADIGCGDCEMCFDEALLRRMNTGIAFAAHGAQRNKVRRLASERAGKRRLAVTA